MFRVSQHPSSGVLKTVTATSGTGHNTGTATSLTGHNTGTATSLTGHNTGTATSLTCHNTGTATSLGGKQLYQYYDPYRRLRLQFLVLLMIGAVTPETCRVTLQ